MRQSREPSAELAKRQRAVGDLIRRVREKTQMTQEVLGGHLLLSRKIVGLIENGKRPINQWEMDVLKRHLGLTDRAFFEPPEPTQLVCPIIGAALGSWVATNLLR